MDEKGEGWLLFAAIVLGVAGIMRVFDAIWAFRYHGVLPQNFEDAIFGHSLKTYGWVYLIVAIVLILSAFGVMARSQFSRWIGIFAGAVMAVSAIWWMPFYPVWSLTYIFVGVLVVYGLSAYGGQRGDDVAPSLRTAGRRPAVRQAVLGVGWSGGGSYDSCPPSRTSFVARPSTETQRSWWIRYGSGCQPQAAIVPSTG